MKDVRLDLDSFLWHASCTLSIARVHIPGSINVWDNGGSTQGDCCRMDHYYSHFSSS